MLCPYASGAGRIPHSSGYESRIRDLLAVADYPVDPPASDRPGTEPSGLGRTAALGVASAVLFGLGLLVTESVGEVAVDVDLKPFFIPYLLVVVTRFGIPTLSIGVGAATGEGLLDVLEGYELDDPVGFLGYVIGFIAFGWYLSEVAEDPTAPRSMTVAALLGAFVQACFEGVAFLVFDAATPTDVAVSVVGNTVTHGLLLGAVPLVVVRLLAAERLARTVA
jgi:hypothetical protein